MSQAWIIRPATSEDIPALVAGRLAMFESMHPLEKGSQRAELEAANLDYMQNALPIGEYRAWVAEAQGKVIATCGLTLRQTPPRPRNPTGKEGYIMSVYTWPEWRRQGIARAMMATILATLQAEGIPQASLRASPDGRPLYEQIGFKASNEMIMRVGEKPTG